jgi:hypothetical protein
MSPVTHSRIDREVVAGGVTGGAGAAVPRELFVDEELGPRGDHRIEHDVRIHDDVRRLSLARPDQPQERPAERVIRRGQCPDLVGIGAELAPSQTS